VCSAPDYARRFVATMDVVQEAGYDWREIGRGRPRPDLLRRHGPAAFAAAPGAADDPASISVTAPTSSGEQGAALGLVEGYHAATRPYQRAGADPNRPPTSDQERAAIPLSDGYDASSGPSSRGWMPRASDVRLTSCHRRRSGRISEVVNLA